MPPAATSAAIPAHAALLRDFANTLDVDEGTDALTEPAELTAWLYEHDLLDSPEASGDDDLAVARQLRAAVRAAFRANHDDAAWPSAHAPADDLARAGADLPLALQVRGGRPLLQPLRSGVRGGLTRLLVAAAEAGADGSWRRLKICVADDCAWAFYDTSKNQSRTWCSMRVCGNRAKTRSYRARRTPGSAEDESGRVRTRPEGDPAQG